MKIVKKTMKLKKPKITGDNTNNPEDYEFMGSDDESLHQPGDTGI
jgi:hypothetical protein